MYYFRPFKFFPSKEEEEVQADITLYTWLTVISIVLFVVFIVVPAVIYLSSTAPTP
jgi:hypothetical protein